MGRTDLATAANVNYNRLVRCLAPLQESELVELAIKDNQIVVKLTPAGRDFASMLSKTDIMRL